MQESSRREGSARASKAARGWAKVRSDRRRVVRPSLSTPACLSTPANGRLALTPGRPPSLAALKSAPTHSRSSSTSLGSSGRPTMHDALRLIEYHLQRASVSRLPAGLSHALASQKATAEPKVSRRSGRQQQQRAPCAFFHRQARRGRKRHRIYKCSRGFAGRRARR